MKRVFLAIRIELSENTLNAIQKLKYKLSDEKIRWVSLQNMHITLKFLGDTDEKKIEEIIAILKKNIENNFRSFHFRLSEIGVFKSIYRPRVIWMGILPVKPFLDLNTRIETSFSELGIMQTENKFSPHLTLGRMKLINNINILKALLVEHKTKEFDLLQATEIVLFESILKPEGSVYNELFVIPLQKTEYPEV